MGRLEAYIVKGGRRLRLGYTTGSCAAGAASAAASMLLGGGVVRQVSLIPPKGIPLLLDVECTERGEGFVSCGVRKDAGDDPDATDGMLICAKLSRQPRGIAVLGGEGIGTVTKPGLQCPVGEAAINPVPRRMIREALENACAAHGYGGGLRAEIFAPRGAETAKRTYNPRLGIEGGISILGTSGIVEPMSEAALLDTVKAEIDMRRARGESVLLLVPGNYGGGFARERFGIGLDGAVKCSNLIGETLDYAVYSGYGKILLMGHAGKLVKLAAGIMHTHSSVADGRAEVLAAHAALCGADGAKIRALMGCVTVDAADTLLRGWELAGPVWESIARRVRFHLEHRMGGKAAIAFASFAASGVVMCSDNLPELVDAYKAQFKG